MIHLILLDTVVSMRLYDLHDLGILFYTALNPIFLFVKLSQEAILHLNHNVSETGKQTRFMVLPRNNRQLLRFILYFLVGPMSIVFEVAVVNNSKHFIHSLNVLDPWIQLRVNKQYSMKDVCMSLDIVLSIVSFLICLFCIQLSF